MNSKQRKENYVFYENSIFDKADYTLTKKCYTQTTTTDDSLLYHYIYSHERFLFILICYKILIHLE